MWTITVQGRGVRVVFDTYAEYQAVQGMDQHARAYMRELFTAFVGLVMPIEVEVRAPVPVGDMLPEAKKLAQERGLADGTIVLRATLSHPDIDGCVLEKELLPALMTQGLAKEVAREVAR